MIGIRVLVSKTQKLAALITAGKYLLDPVKVFIVISERAQHFGSNFLWASLSSEHVVQYLHRSGSAS